MKRIIVLVLVAALLLTACSAKSKTKWPMSEQHEKYGRKALEIADAYLDFDLTLEEANKKIDDLHDAENSLPDGTKEQETGNLSVKIDVSVLRFALSNALARSRGLTGLASKESADVLKARNDLAELLGEKTR